ncbi:UAA transporter [Artomyces pyxidatus]|uniref:UAA transporter n=1 Tax=Artomyces pyxidatus TaxID=48021 RepID=A0ACB8TBF0_9AGAM|nr:UAA transporter [Artomyces pyxidatus]
MSRRRTTTRAAAQHTASAVSEPAAGSVAGALIDYAFMVSLVFGGCCTNVWAYEELLRMEPRIGTALTFSQMLFITAQQLPSQLLWNPRKSWIPTLKPSQVPISQWLLQVLVFSSGSLLNNLVFAFSVPLTVQIVFRSAGLAVSMLFGRFLLGKRYSFRQMIAVSLVSLGVIIATLYRPSSPSRSSTGDLSRYAVGVTMLTASLVCTGILGILQERTYQKYGPCWQEGVFYTHALSLPMFIFMVPQVKHGLTSLSQPSATAFPLPYIVLALNLLSQLICVSGVNQLSSRMSSVSTQVVLTTRKAISLCFSVWWFGNGWNIPLGAGASMVFLGSFWYSMLSTSRKSTGSKKS